VDVSAARDFAAGLHDQLYLEVGGDGRVQGLKIKDAAYYYSH
jgi:hypothetical protein